MRTERTPRRVVLGWTFGGVCGAALALLCAGAALAQDAPEGEAAPAGVLTRKPELVHFVDAVYPPLALDAGATGEVVMQLTLSETGEVTDVVITQSAGSGFDEAAAEAARQFRFTPAEIDGVPAAVQIFYRYAFTLEARTDEVPVPVDADRPVGLLRGRLLEKGTRAPIPGLVVALPGLGMEVVSDAEGRFELPGVAEGPVLIRLDDPAFYAIDDEEQVEAGKVTEVRYYLEHRGAADNELVVVGKRVKKEVARRTLTLEEIRKIPGTSGDALKVVQNLPGVARIPFGGGALVVRGSNPTDSGAVINGHWVPLVFHFGGLRSVLPSTLLESIEFYPGNFSAEFGRFGGGIIDVRVRRPKKDRLHGYVEADFFDAGLLLEGPLTENSTFAVAGRRSYIDLLLPLVIPDDAGVSFNTAPRYHDYQLIYDWKKGRHRVRTFFFGSNDEVVFLFKEPLEADPAIRGTFQNEMGFYRLYTAWDVQMNDRVRNEMSVAVGRNKLFFSGTDKLFFDNKVWVISGREEVNAKLNERLRLRLGLDAEMFVGHIVVVAPRPPKEGSSGGQTVPLGSTEVVRADQDFLQSSPAVWAQTEVNVTDDLLLVPGLRVDYETRLEDVAIDPRLTARYTVVKDTVLKGGVGRYTQRPQPDESDEKFGNPDIKLEHVLHYSVGVEQQLTPVISLDVQLFYKDMRDLVSRVDDPAIKYENIGRGRVYGAEILAKHELTNKFFGWVSYTLMRSERKDSPEDDWRVFDLDQTHILVVLGQYKLSNNWEIGARWRLVSGNPGTPFYGGMNDQDANAVAPYPGATNSERMPPFHQLDLRVDRNWIFDLWTFTAYLEIQNVYNRANPEGWSYNWDYTERERISGTPIIPSFGLRGEF